MNSEYQNTLDKKKLIGRLSSKIKSEIQRTFPNIDISADDSLAETIIKVHMETLENLS